MTSAYPKKLRFVDDPIDAALIPADCRDEYGVDAVKLVRHLNERGLKFWEMFTDEKSAADELTEDLRAKDREYEGLLTYCAGKERVGLKMAQILADGCHEKASLENECWKCRLGRDPHDCDKVTASDWLEYARREVECDG